MVEKRSTTLSSTDDNTESDAQRCDKFHFLISTENEANKIDNYMSNVFGADYKTIKDIFYHICVSKDFQFKILVTRRAYLLFKIFESIFHFSKKTRPEDAEENFKIRGIIYDSHSLNLINKSDINLPNGEKQNRFLIFDDVIVHGRAIKKNFYTLKEKGIEKDNISVWCLYKNQNTDCLTEEVMERITVYMSCDDRKWKRISDAITDIVIRFGQGYTSYIDTYRFTSPSHDDIQKLYQSFLKIENKKSLMSIKLDSLKEFEVQSYVTISKDDYPNKHKIDCVRFYQCNDNEKNNMFVIPYVFFDTVKAEDALSYAVAILEDYGIQSIPSCFVPKTESEQTEKKALAPLLLKWTCNTVGKTLTGKVLQKKNISLDTFTTVKRQESFGEIERTLINLTDIDKKFLNQNISYNNDTFTSDIEVCRQTFMQSLLENYECMKNANAAFGQKQVHQLIKNAFAVYAYQIREKDEERARSQKERHIGVRISDIIACLTDFFSEYQDLANIFSKEELENQIVLETIALFIDNWDCGLSAYDFEIFEDENGEAWVSGFMRNGEQVFRSLYKRFPEIYQYYHIYTAYTLKTGAEDLRLFGEYLQDKLPSSLAKQAYLFNEYMKSNTSYNSDVYVVAPVGKIPDSVFSFVERYVNSY